MLNIYEGMLKIINPKLYNSPYMANIKEVEKVLDSYKSKSKVFFSINLFSLSIEEMPSRLKELYKNALALYVPFENTIYISDFQKKDDSSNHELFHVSSNNFIKKSIGITTNDNIENLDEGITEYLRLKSKNKLSSDYSYQLEVFVVEFLTFIYGDKILEPYFSGNGKKFYRQFGKKSDTIKKINSLLKEISERTNYHAYRLNYLLALELFPNIKSIISLDDLELNIKTKYEIKSFFENNKEIAIKLKELKNEQNITIYNYKYSDINNNYCVKWEENYKTIVCDIFERIVIRLVEMAFLNNKQKNEILEFLEKSYTNKSNRMKDVYSKVFDKILYKSSNYRKGR